MKKKVAVFSSDDIAGKFYVEQLHSLFGEYIELAHYSIKDGTIAVMPPANLYAVFNDAFESREAFNRCLPEGADHIEVGVTFSRENLAQLSALPSQNAFFVNLSKKMVREAITQLSQLGINHLNFIPYYPGVPLPEEGWPEDVALAITPREGRFAPRHVSNVIDLGHRILDSVSIVEIAIKLKLDFLLETEKVQKYFRKTANHRHGLDELCGRSRRLESRFEILTELFDEGIIGVNEDEHVYACNSKAVEITGINRNLVLKSIATETFPEIPFVACRQSGERIESRLVKIQGRDVRVRIVPVLHGRVYKGAIAMLQRFDEQESRQQRLRVQLLDKGHNARYCFENILGESPQIHKAVATARKMAHSDSSILITGESGTGKELFAHAIHQVSPRAKQPFIAVNCGALPDTLLESELFGYEEGAFTGAKKGGKQGLFEFAHLGTLFLDEIDGMSPALQVRLLRVLQEKEVMRVGGRQLLRVNVRIISASNKELESLVESGTFRRDLYFRLNTLPVHLPPLRERRQDIMVLFDQFKNEMGARFSLSPQTKQALLSHRWPGNIRELRNYVEWCVHLDKDHISLEDLPHGFFSRFKAVERPAKSESQEVEAFKIMAGRLFPEYMFILGALGDKDNRGHSNGAGGSMGRDSLLRLAEVSQMPISQREVRTILAHLDSMGLIKIYKGRGGSRITPRGLKIVEHLTYKDPAYKDINKNEVGLDWGQGKNISPNHSSECAMRTSQADSGL